MMELLKNDLIKVKEEKIALADKLEKKNNDWEEQMARCQSQAETITKLRSEKDLLESRAHVSKAQKVAATLNLKQKEKELKDACLQINV